MVGGLGMLAGGLDPWVLVGPSRDIERLLSTLVVDALVRSSNRA